MSMRQSRDELIKRGVLKEIFEKGERMLYSGSLIEPSRELLRKRSGRGKCCTESQSFVTHLLINQPSVKCTLPNLAQGIQRYNLSL